MKRLLILAASVAVALSPAVTGLFGNASFAQSVPVRSPAVSIGGGHGTDDRSGSSHSGRAEPGRIGEVAGSTRSPEPGHAESGSPDDRGSSSPQHSSAEHSTTLEHGVTAEHSATVEPTATAEHSATAEPTATAEHTATVERTATAPHRSTTPEPGDHRVTPRKAAATAPTSPSAAPTTGDSAGTGPESRTRAGDGSGHR